MGQGERHPVLGDALCDGLLLDELSGSDLDVCCATVSHLLTLPVEVLRVGHDPSVGRARLRKLRRADIDRRDPRNAPG